MVAIVDGTRYLKTPEGTVLAQMTSNSITFTAKGDWLKRTLEVNGINIMGQARSKFGNHVKYNNINSDQSLFINAFVDVYFKRVLKKQGFILTD